MGEAEHFAPSLPETLTTSPINSSEEPAPTLERWLGGALPTGARLPALQSCHPNFSVGVSVHFADYASRQTRRVDIYASESRAHCFESDLRGLRNKNAE